MDRVKKIFGEQSENQSPDPQKQQGDDSPDDLFENGLFGNIASLIGNPSDMQKQIEAQLEEIMRQIEAAEAVDESSTGDSTPPIDRMQLRDEEIKGDDFKKLMVQSQGPLISSSPNFRNAPPKKRFTDDEKVMDRIHGTVPEAPIVAGMVSKRDAVAPYLPSGHPRVDIWGPVMPPGGNNGGRGMFQGVITTTVRRADGSTETKKITYDKEGNQTTTINTTDKNGRKETRTILGNNSEIPQIKPQQETRSNSLLNTARHLFVNTAGYTLPRNLW